MLVKISKGLGAVAGLVLGIMICAIGAVMVLTSVTLLLFVPGLDFIFTGQLFVPHWWQGTIPLLVVGGATVAGGILGFVLPCYGQVSDRFGLHRPRVIITE